MTNIGVSFQITTSLVYSWDTYMFEGRKIILKYEQDATNIRSTSRIKLLLLRKMLLIKQYSNKIAVDILPEKLHLVPLISAPSFFRKSNTPRNLHRKEEKNSSTRESNRPNPFLSTEIKGRLASLCFVSVERA